MQTEVKATWRDPSVRGMRGNGICLEDVKFFQDPDRLLNRFEVVLGFVDLRVEKEMVRHRGV